MLNPNEQMITFSTARAKSGIPTQVGLGCWYRWALKGINGVKLEHVRIGRRLFTTMESVARFLAATNTPVQPMTPRPTPPHRRRRSAQQREAEVAQAEIRWDDLSGGAA